MRNNRLILLFIVLPAIILTQGCIKQEKYPIEPQIQFISFENIYDTGQYAIKGVLTISFTDGNGDIGLRAGDTIAPFEKGGLYYYNYVITYFEKQNGTFIPVVLDPPYSARLPVLNPEYPGRAIKGTITDTLVLNPYPVYDTIRFDAFIYDKALNKSNTITTPVIVTRRPF